MAKNKKSPLYYLQKYYLILAGGALVFVGALLFSNLRTKSLTDTVDNTRLTPNFKSKTYPTTSISQPTPTPYDHVENGVYVNNMYGFSFKYPNKLFTRQSPVSEFTLAGFTRQEWLTSDNSNNLFLTLEIIETDKANKLYTFLYKGLVDKNVGDTIGEPGINFGKKISSLSEKVPNSITYYREVDHSTESQVTTFSYVTAWMLGNEVFELSLSTYNQQQLENNLHLFTDISNSIEI